MYERLEYKNWYKTMMLQVWEAQERKASTPMTKIIRFVFRFSPSLAYDLANWLWNWADHTMTPEPTWDAMYADLPMMFDKGAPWLLLSKEAYLYRLRTGDEALKNFKPRATP